MPNIDFNVEARQALVIQAIAPLANHDLMSPFVWEQPDGEIGIGPGRAEGTWC